MKILVLFVCLFTLCGLIAALPKKASKCDKVKCQLPDCRCSGRDIPGGLLPEDTPQFVLLTFDDAVTISNMDFYRKATQNYQRVNPDGCPAAITYFLSHEYTDYSLVNELHSNGHEIGVHSISHTESQRFTSTKVLQREFSDERDLISKFANINKNEMKGIRMPFLQLSGDKQFEFMKQDNFTYDFSWPTQSQTSPGLWPYTLDYASSQDCVIDSCPIGSHPGIWIIPMMAWRDASNRPCAMVDACVNIPKEQSSLVEFMIKNFERSYKTNKAPMGFYTHAAWFTTNSQYFDAYVEFLDYLSSLDDVFIVGASDVLKWMKNPVPLSDMTTDGWSNCRQPTKGQCNKRSCQLKTKDGEVNWFTGCMEKCPLSYPWVGNKFGELKPKI